MAVMVDIVGERERKEGEQVNGTGSAYLSRAGKRGRGWEGGGGVRARKEGRGVYKRKRESE